MKKIFKIPVIVIGSIIIAFVLVIGIWFALYTPPDVYRKKYFDLFIADIYFTSKKPHYSPYDFEREMFVCDDKKRSWPSPMSIQLDWEIPTEQFGEGDSIHVSFMNNSGKKLYCFGLAPYHAIIEDYIITYQESIDTIMWNDLSGIFEVGLTPFKRKEKVTIEIKNPLLLYPGYPSNFLPTDTEKFPEIIKEVYGDTVQIRFTVFVIEIWKHKYSPSYSKDVKIPVDMVIKGWEKGNFKKVKYIPESHQEYFEVRKEMRELYNQ